MSYTLKRKAEVIQLASDFTNDLVDGEAVTGTSTVTIEPSGELTAGSVTDDSNIATADFSDGEKGKSYRVQFKAATDASHEYVNTQTVKVAK